MTTWLVVGAIMLWQGFSKIARLPVSEPPQWLGVVLPLLVLVLAPLTSAVQRPALLLFGLGALVGINAAYFALSPVVASIGWSVPGVLVIVYAINRRTQLAMASKSESLQKWKWWKIAAVIAVAAVLLLPPAAC